MYINIYLDIFVLVYIFEKRKTVLYVFFHQNYNNVIIILYVFDNSHFVGLYYFCVSVYLFSFM